MPILPHGASRENLTSTVRSRLADYIKEHAVDWYNLVTEHIPSKAGLMPNGSLYLVTGCDKAKTFGLCSIPRHSKDAGKHVEMRYRHGSSSRWEDRRPAAVRFPEDEDKNYTLFLRGIRISLSDCLWIKHLPYVEDGSYTMF